MIQILRCYRIKSCPIPLYECPVSAGFPSPAEDFIEGRLDLNDYLIKRPSATYLLRVDGCSMTGAGIHDGDILIVDRSRNAEDGLIVVAAVDGEMTIKRLCYKNGSAYLVPENAGYPAIELTEDRDVHIWGVVVHVIHTVG